MTETPKLRGLKAWWKKIDIKNNTIAEKDGIIAIQNKKNKDLELDIERCKVIENDNCDKINSLDEENEKLKEEKLALEKLL